VLDGLAGVVEGAGHVGGAVDPQDLHRDRVADVGELVEDARLHVRRVVGHELDGADALDLDLGQALEQGHVLVAVV